MKQLTEDGLNSYKGRKVLVTGHTGFVGGWLSSFLKVLGADVVGYSISPPTRPNFFEAADVATGMLSINGDIRDSKFFLETLNRTKPEIVFHLAADPLVLTSYERPYSVFETNTLGTISVLEGGRHCPSLRALINVTSDKCYSQNGGKSPFKETDPLGGDDPYSASKAASEIATDAYRKSYYLDAGIGLCTARAGNIIGGGDWGQYRLLPDIFRSIEAKAPLVLRHPGHVRPWQHVLDVVYGYLMLGAKLRLNPSLYSASWNFGPDAKASATVAEVAAMVLKEFPEAGIQLQEGTGELRHEAEVLLLDSTKAKKGLGWFNRLSLQESVKETVDWHKAFLHDRASLPSFTESRLRQFVEDASLPSK